MVAAVVAVRTAAIISSIALRTACDAQLPSAIFSARALSPAAASGSGLASRGR